MLDSSPKKLELHAMTTVSEHTQITKGIAEQLNRLLAVKQQQSNIIDHNLEKGLGNEESLRQLLTCFLPRKIAVAKGKIINSTGAMSKHIDVIVYDALNCPTLFTDENRNQILPIEGVFGVIEVKTTLTSSTLSDAFENLLSVYKLQSRQNCSTNELVTYCPPELKVFAFSSNSSLKAIATQFEKLSKKHPVTESAYSYSRKSPGFDRHTGEKYLVSSVDILGKGNVRHMLDGTIKTDSWNEYTLGMFLSGVLDDTEERTLPTLDMSAYLNWIMVAKWQGKRI